MHRIQRSEPDTCNTHSIRSLPATKHQAIQLNFMYKGMRPDCMSRAESEAHMVRDGRFSLFVDRKDPDAGDRQMNPLP